MESDQSSQPIAEQNLTKALLIIKYMQHRGIPEFEMATVLTLALKAVDSRTEVVYGDTIIPVCLTA